MITKEMKEQIIKEYGRTEGDTGSPEVQVAILTARINDLNEGYYVLMNFESKPEFPAELERVMKITEGVMRCMTTAVEA